MSSNSDITGLLASLINGTTESPASSESIQSRAPGSLEKALNDSRIRAANSETSHQTNVSKKAIVLEYIEYNDNPDQTRWWKTNWIDVMKDSLPSFDVSETTVDAIAASGITNYSQYRVWILPDNTNGAETIPIVKSGEVTNLGSFTICSVKDAAMSERLVNGALIRIDFENRLLNSDAYVTTVINNTEEFGRAIFNELEGIISASDACEPCGDSRPSVSHPKGDPIGSIGPKDDPTFRKCLPPAAAYAHLEKRETYWPPQQTTQQVVDSIRQSGQPDDVQRIMWLIIAHEQPKFNFLNYNVAGIQLDTTSFSGTTPSDFDYMTCFRDSGGDQRIFAGFSDLNRGMKTFGKTIAGKLSLWKTLTGTTGQMAETMTWNYYHSWNLALNEAELILLKSQGYVMRDGVRYTRHWEQSRETFSNALDIWNAPELGVT